MHRLSVLVVVLVLSACTPIQIGGGPPVVNMVVRHAEPIAGGTVGVALVSVDVEDREGVTAHIRPGDPETVYHAFFLSRFSAHLEQKAQIDGVLPGDLGEFDAKDEWEPVPGQVLSVGGQSPDWVLIVRNASIAREVETYTNAPATSSSPIFQPQTTEKKTLQNSADVVLWDNREGRVVALGVLEATESMILAPTRQYYSSMIAEMVKQLVSASPLQSRN